MFCRQPLGPFQILRRPMSRPRRGPGSTWSSHGQWAETTPRAGFPLSARLHGPRLFWSNYYDSMLGASSFKYLRQCNNCVFLIGCEQYILVSHTTNKYVVSIFAQLLRSKVSAQVKMASVVDCWPASPRRNQPSRRQPPLTSKLGRSPLRHVKRAGSENRLLH